MRRIRLPFSSSFPSFIPLLQLPLQIYWNDTGYGFYPPGKERRRGVQGGSSIWGAPADRSTSLKFHNPMRLVCSVPADMSRTRSSEICRKPSIVQQKEGGGPQPGGWLSLPSWHLFPFSLFPDFQDQQTYPGRQRLHLGSPKFWPRYQWEQKIKKVSRGPL